ncbi:hypothetical protein OF846_000039 [Rhodotorula toruloides]|nr:hypothetical protein OF846_000039 [Rhodotorula toruloides]
MAQNACCAASSDSHRGCPIPSPSEPHTVAALPASMNGDIEADVGSNDSPPASPTSLLHLPDELLDEIIELAWRDLPKYRRYAPCHRLRSSYERMRSERLTLRAEWPFRFASVVQGRPAFALSFKELTVRADERCHIPLDAGAALAGLCSQMTNVRRVSFDGAKCDDLQAQILSMASTPSFLPNLAILRAPRAPCLPNQIALVARILASHPVLEALDLGCYELPGTGSTALSLEITEPPIDVSSNRLNALVLSLHTLANPAITLLAGIVANCHSLTHLGLYHVPNPSILQTLIGALPHTQLLRRFHLSFSQGPEPLRKDGVSLAPYIEVLTDLQELSVGAFCLVFDNDTITALKAREPLQLLHFLPGYGEEPDDVLVGLKRLCTSFPRRLKLDQEEPAAIGDRIDNLYVCCRDDFPSFSWFYQNWIFPDWLHDARRGIYADIVKLAGSHSAAVCGAIIDSFEVMEVWEDEQERYEIRRDWSKYYRDCSCRSSEAYDYGEHEEDEDEWEEAGPSDEEEESGELEELEKPEESVEEGHEDERLEAAGQGSNRKAEDLWDKLEPLL